MSCRLSVIDENDSDYCVSPSGSGSAGSIWRCRHGEVSLHDWQRYNAVTPEVVPLLPAWQNLQFTSCVHPLPCLCSCYKIPLSTRRQKLQLVTIHRRNLSIIHETLIEADTHNTTQSVLYTLHAYLITWLFPYGCHGPVGAGIHSIMNSHHTCYTCSLYTQYEYYDMFRIRTLWQQNLPAPFAGTSGGHLLQWYRLLLLRQLLRSCCWDQ